MLLTLRDRTYHGDNLQGLQCIIGAAVTYSDEQHCLMAYLQESKAFTGRRKLNEELETARKRVAGVSEHWLLISMMHPAAEPPAFVSVNGMRVRCVFGAPV